MIGWVQVLCTVYTYICQQHSMYSPRLHSSAFQRNHSITASSGSAVWQRISPELLHRFGCPLVSDQGLVTACHTPKGNQIRPQTAEKSAWWKWHAKWKKKGEYIGTPFQICDFFAWSLQSDFSGTTAPIWMPFGVLEAGTKPWSDTKGHPNRITNNWEIGWWMWRANFNFEVPSTVLQ